MRAYVRMLIIAYDKLLDFITKRPRVQTNR